MTSDAYENKIIKTLIKERDIKENSAKAYIRAVRKLTGVEPIQSLEFLKDYKKVSNAIDKENKLTSKKTKLIAVLAIIRTMSPDETELLEKLTKKLKGYDSEYMEFLKTQTKTPTQSKNWVSYEELQRALTVMKKNLTDRRILSRTEDEGLTRKEYDDLQKYVVFKTYLTFPMRNDIADMITIKEAAYKTLPESKKKNNNYIVEYNRTKRKFHINVFKNSKRLGK